MHEALITYIGDNLKAPLSPEEQDIVRDTFKVRRLRKRQYLLAQGEICTIAGFIVKGALKQYVLDASGKENIVGLFIENWWAGDRESYTDEKPSDYFIEAIEDTDMLVIQKSDFESKLKSQPFMTELMRALTERQALRLLKRVHAAQALSAEDRLRELQKNNPEFLTRFPQHLLASYLGMTKETFSRIKADSLRKT